MALVYQHKISNYLATEIFNVKNGFSPIIMNKVFNFQENV